MSFRRMIVALVGGSVSSTSAGVAHAATNPTPIAVPLLGTQGQAGPYGSSITVAARGGAAQTGEVSVALHNVTHPCPEELAILLVHGTDPALSDSYLLMSNAGGCRPLQGTLLVFRVGAAPIPDTEPASPPNLAVRNVGPSNYGTRPVFPVPAPPGPYTPGMPPASTNINGVWTLYVLDTAAGNRGVIAGGWSLLYSTSVDIPSQQTYIFVPGTGTGPGFAATAPITFDLRTAPADVPVLGLAVDITLQHTYPDDLRIVLESPAGTAVILMANAGGDTDIAPGTLLTFYDDAPYDLPDATPIVAGYYRPGSVYGNTTLPAPAPASPYETTFAAFAGQSVRGLWKLWVYDDTGAPSGQNTGSVTSAMLHLSTETTQTPVFSVKPTTSTQPFVHVEVVGNGGGPAEHATWRVTQGGTYYDSGPFVRKPGTNTFAADIPVKKGANVIWGDLWSTVGWVVQNFTTTVDEFTYAFAEGSTGPFFDTDITIANPTATEAPIKIEFLPEGGQTVTNLATLNPNTPVQFPVDAALPSAALSTVVHSTEAVPLAAERTMSWDSTGYGGHGASSTAPATRWLFAEGSQGFFNTYVLLANANDAATGVTMSFLVEGGGVVTVPITVLAKQRRTVFAGDVPGLVNQSFGIDITSALPIIAERAMYLPGARLFEGGHDSADVNAPSTQWFLAEGATGSFFETYVLLSNPNSTDANVSLSYLLADGTTIPQTVVVPANGRKTINIENDVDVRLKSAEVSTTITSNVGIVAERAMYWPDISQGWREAHNSFGLTESALRWGLADGRIGGARGYQTFVLLANPNAYPAEVVVRFLKQTLTTTRTYTLDPKSRKTIWVNGDVSELGDGVFSVDVQVQNYQPIAVEKAMYWNAGTEVFAGGTGVTATRLPPP